MLTLLKILLTALTFVCLPTQAQLAAQESGIWVTGRGTAYLSDDLTAADAKLRARRKARADAIERALGVNITAEKFLQEFEVSRSQGEAGETGESFSNYIRESRRGRIVDEEAWQEKSELTYFADGGQVVKYVAHNRFRVLKEENPPDPNFKLDLMLSKSQYQEGEGVVFSVNATQDCYLTVFNLAANDSVYLIFPNVVEKSSKQKANQKRTIPGFGYSFTTALPAGKDVAMESIIAVASKDSLVFHGKTRHRPGEGYSDMWKTGLNDVWRWVAEVDADRRVEAIESFKIYR